MQTNPNISSYFFDYKFDSSQLGPWFSYFVEMAIFFGIILVVAMIFGLILHILNGIGLYKMAQRKKLKYDWLAFVPYGNEYIRGMLTGDFELYDYKITKCEIIFPCLSLVFMLAITFLNLIPIIGNAAAYILYIAYSIFGAYTYYILYSKYSPQNAKVLAIITGIFFGIAAPFIVFGLGNKQPIEEQPETIDIDKV